MNSHNTPDTDLVRDFTTVFGESKVPQQNLEAIAMRMQAVKSMMAMVADLENKKHGLLQEQAQEWKPFLSEIASVKASIQDAEDELGRLQNPEGVEMNYDIQDTDNRVHHHKIANYRWINAAGKQVSSSGTITSCSLSCNAVGGTDNAIAHARAVLAEIENSAFFCRIDERIAKLRKLEIALKNFRVDSIRRRSEFYESEIECRTNSFDPPCYVAKGDNVFWIKHEFLEHLFKYDNLITCSCVCKSDDPRKTMEELLQMAIADTEHKLSVYLSHNERHTTVGRWLAHLEGCHGAEGTLAQARNQLQMSVSGMKVKLHSLETQLKTSQEKPSGVLDALGQAIEKYRGDVQKLIVGSEATQDASQTDG